MSQGSHTAKTRATRLMWLRSAGSLPLQNQFHKFMLYIYMYIYDRLTDENHSSSQLGVTHRHIKRMVDCRFVARSFWVRQKKPCELL